MATIRVTTKGIVLQLKRKEKIGTTEYNIEVHLIKI